MGRRRHGEHPEGGPLLTDGGRGGGQKCQTLVWRSAAHPSQRSESDSWECLKGSGAAARQRPRFTAAPTPSGSRNTQEKVFECPLRTMTQIVQHFTDSSHHITSTHSLHCVALFLSTLSTQWKLHNVHHQNGNEAAVERAAAQHLAVRFH